ncbi:restriction endonuclease subunit S [Pseudoxanthomonas sp. z9]|uniref:restriction endonuclease subunit S n=1 Tax=Pseudoxanthomonas sp. z9 TaxID=2584942 RepID=UPI00114444AA|nr:restriction endonuclease subunit S [Pseudoxanthomonas sp. z9]
MTTGDSAAFGQLCDLVSVQRNPNDIPEATYLGLEHLAPGRMRTIGSGRAADVQSHKFAFQRNDVLYGKLRPYLDKAVLADGDGVCTTELLVFRAKPGVDPRYLACAVHAPAFIEHAMSGVTGAHHPRTSWSHLAQFELPRHDDREQAAIARLLWDVNDLLITYESAIESAEELKRAAMTQLFTRGLRGEAQKETEIGLMPQNWEVVSLGSLGKIGNGSTPKRTVPAYWVGGKFPWLTSAKVYDREIEQADQFVTETALEECHLPRVKPGAVLMAITGQGKTLGHCAVLNIEATISQHVAYVQTDIERAVPGFVRGYLETQYDNLRQVASGGGSTKGALTCVFLKDLPFPLPPTLDEQREIVAILDALDRKIALHRQKRAVLEELFQALLRKLMNGEIRVADLDLSTLTESQATEVAA